MTKYYTIRECFDACGDDDIPYNEEHQFNNGPSIPYSKRILLRHNVIVQASAALSDKWQIKRAEPEVLSVDELLNHILLKPHLPDYLAEYTRKCVKNGRLERDQELRRPLELAKEVKKLYWEWKGTSFFVSPIQQEIESKLQELDEELNNLKPLEDND